MQSAKNTFLKYRSLLIWVVGILVLYTLIGFFILPWVAEKQLVKTLQQRLGVQVSVERIQFNPYTFEATVDNLQLTTEQDEPLAASEKLYLNLQPLHLVRLTLRLEEISLADTTLHFRRYSTTDNTLTRLADNWAASAKEDASEDEANQSSEKDESLFTLEIAAVNYTEGEIHYRDEVPKEPFETVLRPVNIHLQDFSTEASQNASLDLAIGLENDAKLSADGKLSMAPLQLSGQVTLDNFSLQSPYRYFKAQLPFELNQGRLDLQLSYDIDFADEVADIDLSAIDIGLTGFSIHQPEMTEALLQDGKLEIKNASYAFPENQLILDNVSLTDFKLAVSRNQQGDINWMQLIAGLPGQGSEAVTDATDEQTAKQNTSPFTLKIDALSFTEGEIQYRDENPKEPFETVLSPINIQLQDFSTEASQTANIDLDIGLENNAKLSAGGNLTMSPLQVAGQVTLDNFSLQTPYRYFKGQLPVELNSGRVELQTSYDINLAGDATKIDLSEVDIEIAELDIHQPGESEALVQGGKLTISNGRYVYPDNQLTIKSVSLDDFNLAATLNEQGEIDWLQVLENMPEPATDEPDPEASPLQLDIANLAINNTKLTLMDEQLKTPFTQTMMLSGSMQNFTMAEGNQIPFTTDISLQTGGDIGIEGDIQLFPELDVQAEATIDKLALKPVQPYLSMYAHVGIVKGEVSSTAQITSNQQKPFSIQANLTVEGVQLDNQKNNEKLFSFDQLDLNTIDFSLAKQRLAISEVIVDALYARIFINEDGETNVRGLLKEQPNDKAETENKDQDSLFNGYEVSIGKAIINDASSRFTDASLPIVFDTNMQALNGEISGFSTLSEQPVEMTLEGKVDEFGLVEIDGEIKPLALRDFATVKLSFSNIDLPAMSPYTIKFAGRRIDEGRGDVELTYKVDEGELSATNNIVLRDIELGERVEAPDALDLPLDLAVSLLKNKEGVIDLTIPVSGSVSDPNFDMSAVIGQAINQAVTNIVTAPFKFLGGLFGSDNEEPIDNVRFRPGDSGLAPPEQEKLQKLAGALAERPQLAINIPPTFAIDADRQQLKKAAVEQRIESRLDQTDPETQLAERRQTVLEKLYLEAELSPILRTLQQEFTVNPETQDTTELDVLAYNADLKQRLIEAESISAIQLQQLAEKRQQTVIEYIQQHADVNSEQLKRSETESTRLEDGWLKLKFELGTL